MNKHLRLASAIPPLALCLVLGCSESGFKGESASRGEGADAVPAEPIETPTVDSFIEEFVADGAVRTTDLVFAVDTSGSMTEEITNLENNMTTFLKLLDEARVDFKVSALGEGFNFPADPRLEAYPMEVASSDAIGVLNTFFLGAPDLRPGVHLNVIVITDDNGRGNGNLAGDFTPPASAKSVRVHAVVGLAQGRDPNNPDCNIARVGEEYQTLAKDSKGLVQDLCVNDWSKLVKDLSDSIVDSTLDQSVTLSQPISRDQPLKILVNGEPVEQEQEGAIIYEIDYEGNTIQFSKDFAIVKGDKITVDYFPIQSS